MPLLTTSKILSVFEAYSAGLGRQGLGTLLDAIEANEKARAAYNKTIDDSGYNDLHNGYLGQLKPNYTGGEVATLKAGAKLSLQMNTAYYLIKGFKTFDDEEFHIRFENVDDEISDFHLTSENAYPGVKWNGALWMRGRLFFTIDTGVISLQRRNKIPGQGDVQASDDRLFPLAQDVICHVYALMYLY